MFSAQCLINVGVANVIAATMGPIKSTSVNSESIKSGSQRTFFFFSRTFWRLQTNDAQDLHNWSGVPCVLCTSSHRLSIIARLLELTNTCEIVAVVCYLKGDDIESHRCSVLIKFLRGFSLCLPECPNADYWNTESTPHMEDDEQVGKSLNSVVWRSSSLRRCCGKEATQQHLYFYLTRRIIWYSGHFWISLEWPPVTIRFVQSCRFQTGQIFSAFLGGLIEMEANMRGWREAHLQGPCEE